VGDVVPQLSVGVKNNAAVSALNDALTMAFVSATGPFSGSGNLGAGLGAQQSDNSSLKVGISTTTAGVFSGQATFHADSHDNELTDLNLGDVSVGLSGQVNNYASAAFRQDSGSGSFSGGGTNYVLDFGQVQQASAGGHLLATLGVFNNVVGPADVLGGSFTFLDPTDFGETGFNPFSGLAAGQGYDNLNIAFSTSLLGSFQDQIRLAWRGSNASGYQDPADSFILLTLRASVVSASTVPEPGTLWLMLLSLLALGYGASRRRAFVRR